MLVTILFWSRSILQFNHQQLVRLCTYIPFIQIELILFIESCMHSPDLMLKNIPSDIVVVTPKQTWSSGGLRQFRPLSRGLLDDADDGGVACNLSNVVCFSSMPDILSSKLSSLFVTWSKLSSIEPWICCNILKTELSTQEDVDSLSRTESGNLYLGCHEPFCNGTSGEFSQLGVWGNLFLRVPCEDWKLAAAICSFPVCWREWRRE